MLNRIDFGTLGWLKDQANVFWNVELFCSVPAGPIGLHDDKIVCKDFCDMRQKDIHLYSCFERSRMALPLVVFFALQRYFVRGILAGSVKG